MRAESRRIDVSVPVNWRDRAAITWGNGRPAVSAIRFTPSRRRPACGTRTPAASSSVPAAPCPAGLSGRPGAAGRPVRDQGEVQRRVVRGRVSILLSISALAAACSSGGGTDSSTRTATATTEPAPVTSIAARAARQRLADVRGDGGPGQPVESPDRITASNATTLARVSIGIPGTVDSSPILSAGVRHDHDLREDRRADRTVHPWTYTPTGIGGWEGSPRSRTPRRPPTPTGTTSTPPRPTAWSTSSAWPTAGGTEAAGRSRHGDPKHEKLASALNIARPACARATGGYIGDAPPYQGHVVSIDAASGKIDAVFNSLCSNRREIIEPAGARLATARSGAAPARCSSPATGDAGGDR